MQKLPRTARGRAPTRLAVHLAVALCQWGTPAVAAQDPAALCEDAARHAAAESGVPVEVLLAITLTETGRRQGGALRPWPWAINAAGDSLWFATPAEAIAHAESLLAADRQNFDVGCFQLNVRWHGENFASLGDMFDPRANARHAARFLTDLFAETGDWSRAAAAYHSRTPEFADRYRQKFDTILASLDPAPQTAPPVRGDTERGENGFPLLKAGARGGLGSLVPAVAALRSPIGVTP